MSVRKPNVNLKSFAWACPERRRLVCSLFMAILALAASSVTLRGQAEIRIPHPAFMPPDFPATVNAVIPTPKYLPARYELWRIYEIPAAGSRTGKSYVEVEYRDPGCWDRKMNCSLQVFVSPRMDRLFSGTMGSVPEALSLHIGRRTVQARYFADTETEWPQGGTPFLMDEALREHSNYNALIFPLDNFMIGIRADSQAQLSRDLLIKVAGSLTYKAR